MIEPHEVRMKLDLANRLLPITVESCRHRTAIAVTTAPETARCDLLRQLLSALPEETACVERQVCEACCRSFPPSLTTWNPVIASLVHRRMRAYGRHQDPAVHRAERLLRIEAASAPCMPALSTGKPQPAAGMLRRLLPAPHERTGRPVRRWSVGVTTAPRREPTLDRCLDSLAKAGWARPVLFIDGAVELATRFASLPAVFRDEPLGAWPNYYTALVELLMREPLADAYLLAQDDALFYSGECLRTYLEEILWPGSPQGIVSLYCATPYTRPDDGWHLFHGRWKLGAVAFVFPRRAAIELVLDRRVFLHRWAEKGEGRVDICGVIGTWAEANAVPVYFPNPSLVAHTGKSSSIWQGEYELKPARRAGRFIGDLA